jgi:hypothetical protein
VKSYHYKLGRLVFYAGPNARNIYAIGEGEIGKGWIAKRLCWRFFIVSEVILP